MLQQARIDADADAEQGRQQGREMVAEAQRVRERMLRDLVRRRKTLRQQIEQLNAGRERLIEAYAVVRRRLETATNELDIVLPEAKVAADHRVAARHRVGHATLDEDMAALRPRRPASNRTADAARSRGHDGAGGSPAPTERCRAGRREPAEPDRRATPKRASSWRRSVDDYHEPRRPIRSRGVIRAP